MDGAALLRGGLSDAEAHEALVLLAAMGVEAAVERDPAGTSALFVAPADHPRAIEILAEAEAEAASADTVGDGAPHAPGASGEVAPRTGERAGTGRFGGPQVASVSVAILACVAAFLWTTGGALEASYARMLELGAITAARIDAGEVWRLLAAVFLHFDLAHLLANMGTLLLVGPLLARSIGPLRFAAVFIGAGLAGNVVSYALAPTPGLKAGASGAVAGVIGALAGQALRAGRGGRYRRWQIVGAAAAVYALLIGAGANSDHVAHLGGLLAGVALGYALAQDTIAPAEVAGRSPPA